MDPLSILASLAGVSSAGVALSKAIYDLISSIRGTPKEVSDIARGISDLSLTLRELRRVLRDGRKIYRRKLLRRVDSAVRRIEKIHQTLYSLIDNVEGVARLQWVFRRSRTMHLLYQIESHKNGISMLLHIMTLAIETRKLSITQSQTPEDDNDQADKMLLRQQAENLVQVSYQSLQTLAAAHELEDSTPEAAADQDAFDPGDDAGKQIQLWNPETNDTSRWLYELVFSPFTETLDEPSGSTNSATTSTSSMTQKSAESTDTTSEARKGGTTALASRQPDYMQLLSQQAVSTPPVVDELLAEYTTLTEDEIEDVTCEKHNKDSKETDKKSWRETAIRFKDAVGRKFSFPFEYVKTWTGIEELIKQAFLFDRTLGPHVQEGHYDLIGPDEEIYLPSIWEKIIEPGDQITMIMWPLDKFPLRTPSRPGGMAPLPGRPMGMPPPSGLGVKGMPPHLWADTKVGKGSGSSKSRTSRMGWKDL